MKKQNKIKLMSILISCCLSLTSCSTTNSSFHSDSNSEEVIEESIEPSEIMPETTEEPATLESYYLSQLDSIKPEFKHEEYYYDMDYLNELINTNEGINECSYRFDGNIGKVVDQIVDNSKTFVDNNNHFISAFTNLNYRAAITNCLRNIVENCNNDLNSDFHRISNMAIVFGDDNYFNKANESLLYTAIYENELNIIVINKELLESIINYNEFPEYSFIYYIVSHEVNHTRQNVCACNENYEYSNFNYTLDGYSFLMEASAESDLYNTRDFEDILLQFSYQDERKCEGELFLLSILNNTDTSEYYNSIFDIDYDEFFKFFNLSTDEEKLSLLRIIQSIDAKYCRNNIPYEIYDDVSKVTYNDLINEIGFTYKELIFKRCLINLINYTEYNSDFSLQDNLVILNIIKSYLIDDTYTYDAEDINRIYDRETISRMQTMENIYINYLVSKYHTTEESVREYESVDVKVLLEAIIAIAEGDEKNYGIYTLYARNLVSKFPMIIPVLRANNDYSYNTYEERILKINE